MKGETYFFDKGHHAGSVWRLHIFNPPDFRSGFFEFLTSSRFWLCTFCFHFEPRFCIPGLKIIVNAIVFCIPGFKSIVNTIVFVSPGLKVIANTVVFCIPGFKIIVNTVVFASQASNHCKYRRFCIPGFKIIVNTIVFACQASKSL